jgi:hypothetical protein
VEAKSVYVIERTEWGSLEAWKGGRSRDRGCISVAKIQLEGAMCSGAQLGD